LIRDLFADHALIMPGSLGVLASLQKLNFQDLAGLGLPGVSP
jgi:hypothetical protein